jgi:hypothetical protein
LHPMGQFALELQKRVYPCGAKETVRAQAHLRSTSLDSCGWQNQHSASRGTTSSKMDRWCARGYGVRCRRKQSGALNLYWCCIFRRFWAEVAPDRFEQFRLCAAWRNKWIFHSFSAGAMRNG